MCRDTGHQPRTSVRTPEVSGTDGTETPTPVEGTPKRVEGVLTSEHSRFSPRVSELCVRGSRTKYDPCVGISEVPGHLPCLSRSRSLVGPIRGPQSPRSDPPDCTPSVQTFTLTGGPKFRSTRYWDGAGTDTHQHRLTGTCTHSHTCTIGTLRHPTPTTDVRRHSGTPRLWHTQGYPRTLRHPLRDPHLRTGTPVRPNYGTDPPRPTLTRREQN